MLLSLSVDSIVLDLWTNVIDYHGMFISITVSDNLKITLFSLSFLFLYFVDEIRDVFIYMKLCLYQFLTWGLMAPFLRLTNALHSTYTLHAPYLHPTCMVPISDMRINTCSVKLECALTWVKHRKYQQIKTLKKLALTALLTESELHSSKCEDKTTAAW